MSKDAYDRLWKARKSLYQMLAALANQKHWRGSLSRYFPLGPGARRYFHTGSVHPLQSRTDEAIVWLERARTAVPSVPNVRGRLACAYALTGENERAAAELAEARRLNGEDLYSSIAQLKAGGVWGSPKAQALLENHLFRQAAQGRNAGVGHPGLSRAARKMSSDQDAPAGQRV
jgi:hypothetical protein